MFSAFSSCRASRRLRRHEYFWSNSLAGAGSAAARSQRAGKRLHRGDARSPIASCEGSERGCFGDPSERRGDAHQEGVCARRSDRQEQRRCQSDAQCEEKEPETVMNRAPVAPKISRIGPTSIRRHAVSGTAVVRSAQGPCMATLRQIRLPIRTTARAETRVVDRVNECLFARVAPGRRMVNRLRYADISYVSHS